MVSSEQCRRAKPRFVEVCGSGVLVYAVVPVQNRICRFYRDDGIRIQLQYDEHNRLTRMITDMNPFTSLPLSWLGVTLHWGRQENCADAKRLRGSAVGERLQGQVAARPVGAAARWVARRHAGKPKPAAG